MYVINYTMIELPLQILPHRSSNIGTLYQDPAGSEDCDENEGEFEEQFCAVCFTKSERIAKAYKDKHSQSSFT